MAQEEKSEKVVAVKEKPLGGTEVEKTETRATEQPSTAQRGRAERVAGKSGEILGIGLRKTMNVVKEFTDGFSRKMKSDRPPKQGQQVQRTQQTEYRSEQTRDAPKDKVVEKIEMKETKETE